jgi:hypothetical protein
MEKDGIAGVKLRPVDGGTACRFMTPTPAAASTPTAPPPAATTRWRCCRCASRTRAVDRQYYAIVREDHCLGHQEPRTQTIDEYRAEQGLPEYDDLAHGWRQLILKKKSSGPTVGKPSKRSLELFFMTCYDIDRFRSFVASDSFSGIYELPADELHAMLLDDVTLLQFGFRFLRQVLFGEESIALNAEAAQERLVKVQEKRLIEEREAAKKRALEAEQDTGADEGFD